MKSLRLILGSVCILSGFILGGYIGFYYLSLGIIDIRNGQLMQGLLRILLWSELLGIVSALPLVIFGVVILNTLDETTNRSSNPNEPGARSEL